MLPNTPDDAQFEGQNELGETAHSEVTLILKRISKGKMGENTEGADQLLMLVYNELRRLASSQLKEEQVSHTLQPTALVHEAWMKLVDQEQVEWNGKSHFFAIAAQCMRRILVDHARTKKREKRGGGWNRVDLDVGWAQETAEDAVDLVDLDTCLVQLAVESPRQAKVVELRFFGGLSMPMIAEFLETPLRTIEREWRFARAWLVAAVGNTN